MEELPLRDIHLPEPIGWWPPALGWWLLPVFVLILGVPLFRLIRRWRRMTPAKLGLQELEALQRDLNLTAAEKLGRLNILLRRVALSIAPREEVAGLAGEAWLAWLDRPFGAPRFRDGAGRRLLDGPYREDAEADLDELLALCRDWLKVLEKTGTTRTPGRPRPVGDAGSLPT
jgi:hypothetical protein